MITAMLASMRQEIAQRADEQVRKEYEQVKKTDEFAKKADEQVQKSDKPVRHIVEVLQKSLTYLRAETQQYTDKGCDNVRSELLKKV